MCFVLGKKNKIHTYIDLINMLKNVSFCSQGKKLMCLFSASTIILFEIHITLIHGSCSSKSPVLEKYIASINYKQVDFYFHRHYIIFDQSKKRTSPSSSYVLYRQCHFLRHCRINEMRCLLHTNYQGHFRHLNNTTKIN